MTSQIGLYRQGSINCISRRLVNVNEGNQAENLQKPYFELEIVHLNLTQYLKRRNVDHAPNLAISF